MTCTATYAITQADIDAGGGANVGTADSNETPPDTDDEHVPIPKDPALNLVKTGALNLGDNGVANPGDVITYTYVVTNTGNVTLTGVSVTDPKPGLSALSCSPAQPATLAVGASMTCTATYAITQADIDAGGVANVGTAGSNETPPDTDDEHVPIPKDPALDLVKTGALNLGDNGLANPGDVITYTYVVTNTGNVTLTGVSVTDPKPGLSALSCSPAQPATLAVGASMTCTATYAITQANVNAGGVDNVGTADSNETPPDTDDEHVA